ncbi:hypothetical protein HK405_015222, partial [Cladochytrium tenue]
MAKHHQERKKRRRDDLAVTQLEDISVQVFVPMEMSDYVTPALTTGEHLEVANVAAGLVVDLFLHMIYT